MYVSNITTFLKGRQYLLTIYYYFSLLCYILTFFHWNVKTLFLKSVNDKVKLDLTIKCILC